MSMIEFMGFNMTKDCAKIAQCTIDGMTYAQTAEKLKLDRVYVKCVVNRLRHRGINIPPVARSEHRKVAQKLAASTKRIISLAKAGMSNEEIAREKSAKAAARQAAKRKADNSKVEKSAKSELRQRKMEVKPIGYWMKRAQSAFNAWVRARDYGQPCISCGRHHQGQHHAGHYRPAGSNPELRFEPDNCHLQCAPVTRTYLAT